VSAEWTDVQPLVWTELQFGELEAKSAPYIFIAWEGNGEAWLRIIHREMFNGIGIPFQDFSVATESRSAACELAEEMNHLIKKYLVINQ
jgi:hypothetical protein